MGFLLILIICPQKFCRFFDLTTETPNLNRIVMQPFEKSEAEISKVSRNLGCHNATAGCTSSGPDEKKRNFAENLQTFWRQVSFEEACLCSSQKNLESFLMVMFSSSLIVTLLIVFSVDITHEVLWGWRRFFGILFLERLFICHPFYLFFMQGLLWGWIRFFGILFWERLFPPRSLAGRGKFPEI